MPPRLLRTLVGCRIYNGCVDLSRKFQGLFLVVLAAGLGYLLLTAPPHLIDYYEKAQSLSPIAGYAYLAAVALGAVLLFGSIGYVALRLWANTRRAAKQRQVDQMAASDMSPAQQQRVIDDNLEKVNELAADPALEGDRQSALTQTIANLRSKLEGQQLEIVAFGTISSGKSSLLNALAGQELFETKVRGGTTVRRQETPWSEHDKVTLVDTPGLGEVDGQTHAQIARDAARDADILLFVVDGPMRDPEHKLLLLLSKMEKRILLCLNKADWFSAKDRDELLAQLREQTAGLVEADDVVFVRAKATTRVKLRVRTDGSEVEEEETVPADISPLAKRMLHATKKDGSRLLMANVLWRSRALVDDTRKQIEEALEERARQVVRAYMWRAGAAAAVIPMPGLDAAAGLTVSTAMVLDLAKVYRQSIEMKTVERLLGELGKNLVGILGANAVTPALASIVAGAVKTVPGVGTIAGGLMQGLVQALITRWIGLVFIEFFKAEMQTPAGGLGRIARQAWKEVTQREELVALAKTGLEKLRGGDEHK